MNARHLFLSTSVVLVAATAAVANQRDARERSSQFSPEQVAVIHQLADRLSSEVEHLQEDIRIELRGRQARRLHGEADATLSRVIHFQRAVTRNADRRHIYRDFNEMDRHLHRFLETLRASAEGGALQRGISRVSYADQQLHFAVFGGDDAPQRQQEAIARQAHALENESREFARIAEYILQNSRGGDDLRDAIDEYADEAEHFHESYERGADPDHVVRDFRSLQESWQQVVEQLNQSRYGGYLRRRAERVNVIHENLHRLLRLDSSPPRIRYRFELSPDFRFEILPED